MVIVLVIFVAVTFKAPLPRPLPDYLGVTFQVYYVTYFTRLHCFCSRIMKG